MRVTIVPAGPKTSAATIRQLLHQAPSSVDVYGVYRNISKVPAEFKSHKNFHAVYGDLEDASSLDFGGSDTIMTSTPPFFGGEDPFAKAEQVSNNVKNAVERAGGVKRLMLLSSLGAEFDKGVVSADILRAAVRPHTSLLCARTGRDQNEPHCRESLSHYQCSRDSVCSMRLLHGELDPVHLWNASRPRTILQLDHHTASFPAAHGCRRGYWFYFCDRTALELCAADETVRVCLAWP